MKPKGSVIFGLFLLLVSLFFLFWSFSYRGMAEFVPLVFAVPTTLLTLLILLGERYSRVAQYFEVGLEELFSTEAAQSQNPGASTAPRGEVKIILRTFGWFAAFAAIVFLAGFYVATALFALLFMHFQGRIGWIGSIGATLLSEIFFYAVFDRMLQVNFYPGIFFGAQIPPF
jgi:hypothetical protein